MYDGKLLSFFLNKARLVRRREQQEDNKEKILRKSAKRERHSKNDRGTRKQGTAG